ncbi:hypothetical protein F8M49_00550 [Rhodococcus zopfii]|uniref:DUF7159 domain-containing protein n=1 Tax=Rhodococcus zopfii TaxID=43772 RepID=A0ABU3WJW9_9NOCA|nr:hypothetical protein [Rhodococcus zopfii]
MSIGVGLRVGTTVSSVAVTSAVPGQPGPAPIERRSAVHLHQDGTATLGEIDPILDQGASSFTNFLGHVGNPTGIRASDGSLSRAEDLVATAMECLLADAAPLIGDREYTVVAAHPTEWAPATVAVLRNALDYVGLRHVSLVSDAEAAAAWFESQVSRQTGRLVAVYHIDDLGSTVTLVRAGIAAGKPVRFGLADAPPVTTQLSTALAGYGWQMANLDAVVVTIDENVDTAAAQLVAQSVKAGLGTRCALAPDPHQTMVRGAALAAAAGSVEFLGSTQIIPMTRANLQRKQTPQGDGTPPRLVDPDATTMIPKITPHEQHRAMPATAQAPRASVGQAPVSTARAGDVATIMPEEEPTRRPSPILLAVSAVAVVVLAVVGVLVLTQRGSAAETNPSADRSVTATIPELQSPKPTPTTTTTTTTTTTSAPKTTTSAAPTTTSAARSTTEVASVGDSTAPAEAAELPATSRQAGSATVTTTAPQSTTTRPAPGWQTTDEKPTRERDRDRSTTPTPTQQPGDPEELPDPGSGSSPARPGGAS